MAALENTTAILLAGGQGTRIRALYPDVPKPLIPVNGRPFLHWATAFLAGHGLRDFVYSTGFKGEQIEAWCRDGSLAGLSRRVCYEDRPLGTGGGLINCLDLCGEWIVAANGDSLCLGGVAELLALAGQDDVSAALVGVYRDDTSRYGSLEVDDRGRLTHFREKVPGQGYINAGTYLFRTAALRDLPRGVPMGVEIDLIPGLLAKGATIATVLVRDAPFIDIGTPESVREAGAFVEAHSSSFAWE